MNAMERLRLNLKARRKNRALVTVEAKDLREVLRAADRLEAVERAVRAIAALGPKR